MPPAAPSTIRSDSLAARDREPSSWSASLPRACRSNASSSATRASAAWPATASWRRAAASCARRLSTSCRDCLRLLGPLPRLSLPLHPRVRFRQIRQLPSRLRIVKAQPSPGQPQLRPQHLGRQMQASRHRQPRPGNRRYSHALNSTPCNGGSGPLPASRRRTTATAGTGDDGSRRRLRRRRQSGHYGQRRARRVLHRVRGLRVGRDNPRARSLAEKSSGGQRIAVLSVPRPLQDRLGYATTASLVKMLRQLEEDQENRREVHRQLIADQMQSHRHGARAVEEVRFHGFPYVVSQFRPRDALSNYVIAKTFRRGSAVGLLRNYEHEFCGDSCSIAVGCYTHAAGCVRCGVSGLAAPCRRAAELSLA